MASIDKKKFIKLIFKGLNKQISYEHIRSVVELLCAEIVKELESSNKFTIKNFGTFKRMIKSRKFFNIENRVVELSDGNVSIKFKIDKNLKKMITKYLLTEESYAKLKK